MDLRPLDARPTDEERAAIDAVLAAHASPMLPSPPPNGHTRGDTQPTSLARARGLRHLLLPALHAAQRRRGFVSAGALGYICERLAVPPAEAYGVATFYALFALAPRPPVVAHVCDDVACKAKGADRLCHELTQRLGPAGEGKGETTWHRSPCLGLCEQAPAAMLVAAGAEPYERSFGHADLDAIVRALETRTVPEPPPAPLPQKGDPSLRLLRRVGVVDPESLADYRAHGGYRALRRAFELSPAGVLREVTESKLVGRGGAAFPTGRKWEAVAKNVVRPHFLVCNADESEPGTFKDRVLMEQDPFALLEALTIAGLATGSEKAFVYLRAEYPLARKRLENAVQQARAQGLLGDDVMGKGLRFDVELRVGAGAYICGEETALFASLEGFRGEPRTKPPFPVDVGLFGKPTVVNNVETLVNVLDIVLEGASAYRALGTEGSPGTRLFCVSGNVEKPGLYELPFGVTLAQLIARAGGVAGAAGGKKLQAVLLGGAAGTFLGPGDLDLKLTFEDTRRASATLGSGVVLVLDDGVPLVDVLRRIAGFFRDESCGQCVPCRVGTVRQEELLERLARDTPLGSVAEERALLAELGQAMRDASICGLGQTASSAIESALVRLPVFRDEGPTTAKGGER